MLNAAQYMELAKEAYLNAGKDMNLFPFTDNELNQYSTTDTDWGKVFYGTGNTLQTNISLQGGSNNSNYYVSGSYFSNKSTVKGNEQQRASVRTNVGFQLHRKFKAILNLTMSYNRNNIFNPGKDYYEFLPIVSPYYSDSTLRLYNRMLNGLDAAGEKKWSDTKFFNTVAEREENTNKQNTFYTNGNIQLKYNVIAGLDYTCQVGLDLQNSKEETYASSKNWTGYDSKGYSNRNTLTSVNWSVINRLNYNMTFGKHTVGALLGIEATSKEYTTVSAYGSGFINDRIQDVSYASERHGNNSSSTTRTASLLLGELLL